MAKLTLRARKSIREPLDTIRKQQDELKGLNATDELVVRAEIILTMCHRLVESMDSVAECDVMTQMQDAQALDKHAKQVAQAAVFFEELAAFVEHDTQAFQHQDDFEGIGVVHLDVIKPYVAHMPQIKTTLREHIENLLLCGLRNLSPGLLGSALQAAYHLGLLTSVVHNLLDDLTDVLAERTNAALDLIAVGKQLGETQPPVVPFNYSVPMYRSRVPSPSANTSNSAQVQKWTGAVWRRIRGLIVDELAPIHAKVYMLERVLQLKHGKDVNETFSDVVKHELKRSPTDMLLTSFCNNLELLSSECIQESNFWKFVFVASYPKLLRNFRELLSRVAMLSDNAESQNAVPEPIRAYLSIRTQAFLKSTLQRWEDARQRVRSCMNPNAKNLQSENEVPRFVHMLRESIEECAFDKPLLSEVVATASNMMDTFFTQISSMIRKDESAFSMTTPQPSQSQACNISVGCTLKQLLVSLADIDALELSETRQAVTEWQQKISEIVQKSLLEPLLTSFRYDLTTILGRVHRFRLNRPALALRSDTINADASVYMHEFCARTTYFRTRLLPYYTTPLSPIHWYVFFLLTSRASDFVALALSTFIIHATLLRLPSDSDKLQIVTDMTTLELAMSQLLSDASRQTRHKPLSLHDCGVPFQAVRSFRTLLFEPLSTWKDPAHVRKNWHIPDMILVQHLLSKSSTLPFPNDMRRMSKPAYVDWAISTSQVKHAFFSERVQKTVLQEVHNWLETQSKALDASTLDKLDQDTLECLRTWDQYFQQHNSE